MRHTYAATPGSFVIDAETGRPVPHVLVTVWTEQVAGVSITDLVDADGNETTYLTSDALGFVQFQGPDDSTAPLWLDSGTGSRMVIQILDEKALLGDLSGFQDSVDDLNTEISSKLDVSSFTAAGDILVGTGAGSFTPLQKGALGQFVGISGNQVAWATPPVADVLVSTAPESPVGSVIMWFAGAIPEGYAELNGQTLDTTSHPDLFSIWGYSFGGSGASFNLPDARSRTPFGFDENNSLFDSTSAGGAAKTGGANSLSLSAANLPPHVHNIWHGHPGSTTNNTKVNAKMSKDGGNGSGSQSVRRGTHEGDSNNSIKDSAHNHTLNIAGPDNASSGSAGAAAAFSTVNAYFTVIFLVKAKKNAVDPVQGN